MTLTVEAAIPPRPSDPPDNLPHPPLEPQEPGGPEEDPGTAEPSS